MRRDFSAKSKVVMIIGSEIYKYTLQIPFTWETAFSHSPRYPNRLNVIQDSDMKLKLNNNILEKKVKIYF